MYRKQKLLWLTKTPWHSGGTDGDVRNLNCVSFYSGEFLHDKTDDLV